MMVPIVAHKPDPGNGVGPYLASKGSQRYRGWPAFPMGRTVGTTLLTFALGPTARACR